MHVDDDCTASLVLCSTKPALAYRAVPCWMCAAVTEAHIVDTIRTLTARRAPSTICPSEVARALAPNDWRPLMPRVREAAARLADSGEIVATQRGVVVDALDAHGPIRLSRP